MNKKNKIIVFGGSGFLGSHVADSLSDQGYKVTIFDKTPFVLGVKTSLIFHCKLSF